MSVAPSFQHLERVGEPFEEGGKEYILVRYADGHTRKVRWYEEPMKKLGPLKNTLGFNEGYIYIFKGDVAAVDEWFRASIARFHTKWGWYIISTAELPQLPAGIEAVKLYWKDVAFEDQDILRPDAVINKVVSTLLYGESTSKFVGSVGDKIEAPMTVVKVIDLPNGFYGPSKMFIMRDPDENEYVWTTGARILERGETYNIRGWVKNHSTFRNIEQTILTRCKVL